MARSRFDLDASGLIAGLETFDPRLRAAVDLVLQKQAAEATAYMKINAPWTDRTGNARSSLGAEAISAAGPGGGWILVLFGRAAYQIWLETRYAGRDAIVTPTMRIWGPKTMSALNRLIDRMGRR